MSNVAINIAAEYTGKPAFKEAARNVQSLERTVKRFAGGLGIGLGLSAVTAFGKAAVKAFAADEAAAVRLSGAVNNLGIAFANPAIAKYISELEATSAVADDVLRPAFQSLLTTTGSLTQSQKLLANAITISRAKGIDLATVSQDLANGYVGITRGLRKYNTGLTQSELKSKSFSDILSILLKQSSGAANAYLATTSFKFDLLTLAVDNAKEAIGEGLVNAFARAGGGTEAKDAVKVIENIAKAINGITLATGTAVGGLTSVLSNLKNLPKDIFQGFVGKQGGINLRPPKKVKDETPTKIKQEKILAKLESDALKRAKALELQQKKITEEQRKQAALKKLDKVFDLDQANLIAALKRNLSDDERTRAVAQLALLNGFEKVAESLTKKILMTQDATGNLYRLWQTLPDARNPFEYLEKYLEMLAGKAAALFAKQNNVAIAPPVTGAGGSQFGAGPYLVPSTNVAPLPAPSYNSAAAANRYSDSTGPIQVSVNIDGKAIASSMQNQSLSGTPTGVNRSGGMFGG
jgi:hypothetical protein